MAAAAALVALPLTLALVSAPAQRDPDVAFTFTDPEIVESSGLVMTDELAVTVNDSGDSARIFTVDRRTGDTVGVTTWSADVVDVEALAPAGADEVWVGDIGDNPRRRESVVVTKVPFGRGDRDVEGESYELVYPDGSRDAEALASDPRTGRLYVISKDVFGGTVYRAPKRLDPTAPNRLEAVADAPGLATDAAFTPDGSRLLVRNYAQLAALEVPGFAELGAMRLPAQQQGEGIAVDPAGEVFLSSEGAESEVLRVDLAPALAAGPSHESSATPSAPSVEPEPEPEPTGDEDDPDVWPWLLGTGLGVAALLVLVRSLRPR